MAAQKEQLTRAEDVLVLLRANITGRNHEPFAAPGSMEQLRQGIQLAVDTLRRDFQARIVQNIHTSCVLGCDCIIVGARGERYLHLNTHLIPASEYSPQQTANWLRESLARANTTEGDH